MCVCAPGEALFNLTYVYRHTHKQTLVYGPAYALSVVSLSTAHTHTHSQSFIQLSNKHIRKLEFTYFSQFLSNTHTHTHTQSGLLKPLFLAGLSERLRGFRLYKTDRFRLTPSLAFPLSHSLGRFQAYCKAGSVTTTCEPDGASGEERQERRGEERRGGKEKLKDSRKGSKEVMTEQRWKR